MAREPRRPDDIKRSPATRKPYDKVLILCEGEQTEINYLRDLCDHYRLSSVNVQVKPADGSNPKSIVDHAIKEKKAAEKKGDPFDRIFCVFDRDSSTNFDSQSERMKRQSFDPIRSWPCFEYWYILHGKYTRAPYSATHNKSASEVCKSATKQVVENYTEGKRGIFKELVSKLETAISHAERSLNDALATDEMNPATEVYKLVVYLRGIRS